MVTLPVEQDPPGRRFGLGLLAVAAAIVAWQVAAVTGLVLGTDAIWPFDRIGLVLFVLAGVERLSSWTKAGGA